MTSAEIKEAQAEYVNLAKDGKSFEVASAQVLYSVLLEIAYQLAIANERELNREISEAQKRERSKGGGVFPVDTIGGTTR